MTSKKRDPKVGTGKKPKGSGRRLYTDENPKDTVSIKYATVADAKKTVAKVKKINKIRAKNSEELVSKGEEPLEPYIFDYILLCNKICGASHYNMQMKIIVETEEEFNNWYKNQTLFKNSLIAQN